MCDALAWVQEAKPSVIIDMATLTGTCCIALGSTYTGLFTRDPQLSANLVKAGAYLHIEVKVNLCHKSGSKKEKEVYQVRVYRSHLKTAPRFFRRD